MFDKFGEFDSAQEMCELANNLFNEGDLDSIRALGEENGLDEAMIQMYLEGYEGKSCTHATAGNRSATTKDCASNACGRRHRGGRK